MNNPRYPKMPDGTIIASKDLPLKVRMPPGLARVNGRCFALGGMMMEVPPDTTMETLGEYMVYSAVSLHAGPIEKGMQTRWTVKGSRGDEYTVRLETGKYRCNCPGYQYHRKCKHAASIASQHKS